VQRALMQRQQQSDEFALQLRQSQERLQTTPGDLNQQQYVESRQLDERRRLENLGTQQQFSTGPRRSDADLSRERQIQTEQPGCLHTTMDLYRASVKLMPLLCSDLLADTFELSYAARALDMRASPYDLSGYGYAPVEIETPAGRAQYVREQQVIATRGQVLRATLLERCRDLLAA